MIRHNWRALAGIVFAFGALALAVSAAYALTSLLYGRLGLRPPALLEQVINALLGLFFLGLIGTILARNGKGRRIEMQSGFFGPIIQAIDRIARGDYDIHLEDTFPDTQPLGLLVKSVNNMASELTQMEALRQEFVSNVSHELQSPLTSIRGFAQALHDPDLGPDDRLRYLGIIEAESTRLSRLTENLLSLAALDSERAPINPRPYRLDRQVRAVILACEPQWRDKDIELDADLDEVTITADEDLLSQVWTNLLNNSLKFTGRGGRVRVTLHCRDGQAEFTISDNGIGIAEADQDRVFERFYKADPARERSKGGSGLGLSIAKTIVDLHQGRIGLESRPGAGATFTVRLPAG